MHRSPCEPKPPPGSASDEGPNAVLDISERAFTLNRQTAAERLAEEERLDRIARRLIEEGIIDVDKTAEALMRQITPELYAALVDAGEVEP